MDKFSRIYMMHKMLRQNRYPVSMERLCEKLECSERTVQRIRSQLVNTFNAPIAFDSELKGYQYTDDLFELPGIWFNSSEMIAILAMRDVLQQIEPGFFREEFKQLQKNINKLVKTGSDESDISERLRLIPIANRKVNAQVFQTLASALIRRKQLIVEYQSRSRGSELLGRRISPQRMIRYRDNWYLDCFCHLRDNYRTFALEQIQLAQEVNAAAKEIPKALLDAHTGDSYGIFSGKSDQTAVLQFNALRAQWVSHETWHPKQIGKYLNDGSYQLEIPYKHSEELVMDILRYGPDVKVVSPDSLQFEIKKKLRETLAIY